MWLLAVRRRQRSPTRNLAAKRAVDVLAKQPGQLLAHAACLALDTCNGHPRKCFEQLRVGSIEIARYGRLQETSGRLSRRLGSISGMSILTAHSMGSRVESLTF